MIHPPARAVDRANIECDPEIDTFLKLWIISTVELPKAVTRYSVEPIKVEVDFCSWPLKIRLLYVSGDRRDLAPSCPSGSNE